MQTNKALFRAPKTCRERWLNHLDHSKVKGNWTVEQDMAIFSYVVQEGKRWSRLVGVLGGKRTEHTIKNRFNAMIAKHRRYKFEKEVKVAIRIRERLRNELEGHQGQQRDSRFKEENVSAEAEKEGQGEEPELKLEQAEMQLAIKVQMQQRCVQPAQSSQDNQQVQIQVKQEQAEQQQPQLERVHGVVYPFQNYSYEWEVYNQACFQHTPIFYCPPIMPIPLPTADTSTREAKILQQRRKRRERPEE